MTKLMRGPTTWSLAATVLAVLCAGCRASDVTGIKLDAPVNYDAIGSGRLVFERSEGSNSGLILFDGRARTSRVLLSDAFVRGAVISPDGNRLAYTKLFNGPGILDSRYDIAIRELATGTEIRLTTDDIYQGMPTWTPNGQDVVYPANEFDYNINDYWQVSARANGASGRRPLTRFTFGASGQIICPIGQFDTPAVLSVHGELAVLCRGDVYLKATDSAAVQPVRIDGLGGNVQAIAWSPEGERLAYSTFLGAQLLIKSVKRDGSADTTIASVPSVASNYALFNRHSLCWTAEGTRIFFNATQGTESSQVWVVRSDGTGLAQITNTPGAFDFNVSCT